MPGRVSPDGVPLFNAANVPDMSFDGLRGGALLRKILGDASAPVLSAAIRRETVFSGGGMLYIPNGLVRQERLERREQHERAHVGDRFSRGCSLQRRRVGVGVQL
jgi:hypothetical protein